MGLNTWQGDVTALWSGDGNWTLGVKPIADDDVSFNNIESSNPCTIDEDTPVLLSCVVAASYLGTITNTHDLKTKWLHLLKGLVNNNAISISAGGDGLQGGTGLESLTGTGYVLLDQNAKVTSLPATLSQVQLLARLPSGGLPALDYSGFGITKIYNDSASDLIYTPDEGTYIFSKFLFATFNTGELSFENNNNTVIRCNGDFDSGDITGALSIFLESGTLNCYGSLLLYYFATIQMNNDVSINFYGNGKQITMPASVYLKGVKFKNGSRYTMQFHGLRY